MNDNNEKNSTNEMLETELEEGNQSPEVILDDYGGILLASESLPDEIFILPVLHRPILPGSLTALTVPFGKLTSVAVNAFESQTKIIGLILLKYKKEEEIVDTSSFEKLYEVGSVARIVNGATLPDGNVRIVINVLKRFKVLKFFYDKEKAIKAKVQYYSDEWDKNDEEIPAYAAAIISTVKDIIKFNPIFSQEMNNFLMHSNISEPGKLTDIFVSMTSAEREELQEILELFDLKERMTKALQLLQKEERLSELKEKIKNQIEEKISSQQREYFLKEQLKAIKNELGIEKDKKSLDIQKFQEKLSSLTLPEEAKEKAEEELEKFALLDEHSPELGVTRNYLEWITNLPWGIYSDDLLDVKHVQEVLNNDHYGLDDIKQRILEFVAVSKLKGGINGSILCFVGPPGVGKTSLGRSIANSLGRKFYRFSLGGMRDEAEIKGHRRTYIGAMPGKLIQALKTCKTSNPVIMLDEIDKLGVSYQGDPASALLEVLDPEQNHEFLDHYIDCRFDLSKILFITTANVLDTIPAPLLDRMEVMKLSGYILDEKLEIAKRHIIPKQLKENGLSKSIIKFNDTAIREIISGYARESGVRNLEKEIKNIIRKIAVNLELKKDKNIIITKEKVNELLGKAKFSDEQYYKITPPGVVMGLAWTQFGGSTLYIEAIKIPTEKGGYKLTGQLGDVMKESANIAFSYVQSLSDLLHIDSKEFDKFTIHLHVPAGATPKDGPSAGVTMTTSLISLMLNKHVKKNLAMTGEITLTGKVLPVGGIKEKVIAAKRAKVNTIILPSDNQKDYEEISNQITKDIDVYFFDNYKDYLKIALDIQI